MCSVCCLVRVSSCQQYQRMQAQRACRLTQADARTLAGGQAGTKPCCFSTPASNALQRPPWLPVFQKPRTVPCRVVLRCVALAGQRCPASYILSPAPRPPPRPPASFLPPACSSLYASSP